MIERPQPSKEEESLSRAARASEAEALQVGLVTGGEGAALPLSVEERRRIAIFQNGRCLVSEAHLEDPETYAVRKRARERGIAVNPPEAVTAEFLQRLYHDGRTSARRAHEVQEIDDRVRRQVLDLIRDAASRQASDIRVRLNDSEAAIKYRIHGDLQVVMKLAPEDGEKLCRAAYSMGEQGDSTYMSRTNQSVRLATRPEKGIFLPKGVFALRVQYLPLENNGRLMVMRILYEAQDQQMASLAPLGYHPLQLNLFERFRSSAFGLIAFTGPTGSGKSTSLQINMTLQHRQSGGRRALMTVEDPVEYPIPGADQVPVIASTESSEERREAFVAALRAALRSDPDVLMVGEIRDDETAEIAYHAALTGIQVWTTLHTNSALLSFDRLSGFGIAPELLYNPAITVGIIAQRLVPLLCQTCARPFDPEEAELAGLTERLAGLDVDLRQVRLRGAGCNECHTGVIGRSAIAEALAPDHQLCQLLRAGKPSEALGYWLREMNGMTLQQHGVSKVASGLVDPRDVEYQTGPLEHPLKGVAG